MALSKDEQAALDALTKKAAEPDEEDFHVEIWDESGAGAKLPFSQARTYLARFGIGIETPAEPAPADTKVKPDKDAPTVLRHFGKSTKTT
jgi:hypothetical protein